MKKISILIVVLAVLAVSCSPEFDSPGENNAPPSKKTRKFWAQDASTEKFYQLDAQWLAYNSRCEVWVETKNGIPSVLEEKARQIADEFRNVYTCLTNAFGSTYSINGIIMNTMQFADWLGDGNKRLIILLLDIRDYNYHNGSDSYVAGYFWNGDLYTNGTPIAGGGYLTNSNECDMIYMDISPSFNRPMEEFYATLAHEMQHLMNYATSQLYRHYGWRNNSMDLWINEGLSSAAEYVYSNKVSEERVSWYNGDETGYIAKGDNFYLWNNYTELNKNTILNDYATVNLFFQWLRVQYGEGIYKKIFSAHYSDYNAVTSSIGSITWSELFKNWHAANYIQHPDNVYGYKSDPLLKTVKAKYLQSATATHDLYPGEAVYSYSKDGRQLPQASGTVVYFGMNANGTAVNVPAGGALLSFNSDTVKSGDKKNCTVTGESAPKSMAAFSAASVSGNGASLYRIDAGDMIGREKFENDLSGALPPGKIGIISD